MIVGMELVIRVGEDGCEVIVVLLALFFFSFFCDGEVAEANVDELAGVVLDVMIRTRRWFGELRIKAGCIAGLQSYKDQNPVSWKMTDGPP